MKTGQFIAAIASAYQVEEKTVNVFARFLKEAGLLTTGARGVNAPDMTPLDAARLTIAMLATDRPSQAVASALRYGSMQIDPRRTEGLSLGELLGDPEITLERTLEAFFTPSPNWHLLRLSPYVEINENGSFASVDFVGGSARFRSRARTDDDRTRLGIRRSRGVASAETMIIEGIFLVEAIEAGAAPWALEAR